MTLNTSSSKVNVFDLVVYIFFHAGPLLRSTLPSLLLPFPYLHLLSLYLLRLSVFSIFSSVLALAVLYERQHHHRFPCNGTEALVVVHVGGAKQDGRRRVRFLTFAPTGNLHLQPEVSRKGRREREERLMGLSSFLPFKEGKRKKRAARGTHQGGDGLAHIDGSRELYVKNRGGR